VVWHVAQVPLLHCWLQQSEKIEHENPPGEHAPGPASLPASEGLPASGVPESTPLPPSRGLPPSAGDDASGAEPPSPGSPPSVRVPESEPLPNPLGPRVATVQATVSEKTVAAHALRIDDPVD